MTSPVTENSRYTSTTQYDKNSTSGERRDSHNLDDMAEDMKADQGSDNLVGSGNGSHSTSTLNDSSSLTPGGNQGTSTSSSLGVDPNPTASDPTGLGLGAPTNAQESLDQLNRASTVDMGNGTPFGEFAHSRASLESVPGVMATDALITPHVSSTYRDIRGMGKTLREQGAFPSQHAQIKAERAADMGKFKDAHPMVSNATKERASTIGSAIKDRAADTKLGKAATKTKNAATATRNVLRTTSGRPAEGVVAKTAVKEASSAPLTKATNRALAKEAYQVGAQTAERAGMRQGAKVAARIGGKEVAKEGAEQAARLGARRVAANVAARTGAKVGVALAARGGILAAGAAVPVAGWAMDAVLLAATWLFDKDTRRLTNKGIENVSHWLGFMSSRTPGLDCGAEPPRTYFLPLCHDGRRDPQIEDTDHDLVDVNDKCFAFPPERVGPAAERHGHKEIQDVTKFENYQDKITKAAQANSDAVAAISKTYQKFSGEQFIDKSYSKMQSTLQDLMDSPQIIQQTAQSAMLGTVGASNAYQGFLQAIMKSRETITQSAQGLIPMRFRIDESKMDDGSEAVKEGKKQVQKALDGLQKSASWSPAAVHTPSQGGKDSSTHTAEEKPGEEGAPKNEGPQVGMPARGGSIHVGGNDTGGSRRSSGGRHSGGKDDSDTTDVKSDKDKNKGGSKGKKDSSDIDQLMKGAQDKGSEKTPLSPGVKNGAGEMGEGAQDSKRGGEKVGRGGIDATQGGMQRAQQVNPLSPNNIGKGANTMGNMGQRNANTLGNSRNMGVNSLRNPGGHSMGGFQKGANMSGEGRSGMKNGAQQATGAGLNNLGNMKTQGMDTLKGLKDTGMSNADKAKNTAEDALGDAKKKAESVKNAASDKMGRGLSSVGDKLKKAGSEMSSTSRNHNDDDDDKDKDKQDDKKVKLGAKAGDDQDGKPDDPKPANMETKDVGTGLSGDEKPAPTIDTGTLDNSAPATPGNPAPANPDNPAPIAPDNKPLAGGEGGGGTNTAADNRPTSPNLNIGDLHHDGGDAAAPVDASNPADNPEDAGAPQQPQGAVPAEDNGSPQVVRGNDTFQMGTPDNAKMVNDIFPADGSPGMTLRDAAKDAGFSIPDPGQDLGTPVDPPNIQPGDVVVGNGTEGVFVGDGKVATADGIRPLSDVAQFDGPDDGIFRLSQDGGGHDMQGSSSVSAQGVDTSGGGQVASDSGSPLRHMGSGSDSNTTSSGGIGGGTGGAGGGYVPPMGRGAGNFGSSGGKMGKQTVGLGDDNAGSGDPLSSLLNAGDGDEDEAAASGAEDGSGFDSRFGGSVPTGD